MKEYKNLREFLVKESTVLDKREDTNPLYYMWTVVKTANGKTEDDMKKDEFLKKLFKKIDKFIDSDNSKYAKRLVELHTPSELMLSFNGQSVDSIKNAINYRLDEFLNEMTSGIKGFNEYLRVQNAFRELRQSEEMQTVIGSI